MKLRPFESVFKRTRRGFLFVGCKRLLGGYQVYTKGHKDLDALLSYLTDRMYQQSREEYDSPLNALEYTVHVSFADGGLIIKGGNYFGNTKGAWVYGKEAVEESAQALGLSCPKLRKKVGVPPTPSLPTLPAVFLPATIANRPAEASVPRVESPQPAPTGRLRINIGGPHVAFLEFAEPDRFRVNVGNFIGAAGSAAPWMTAEHILPHLRPLGLATIANAIRLDGSPLWRPIAARIAQECADHT